MHASNPAREAAGAVTLERVPPLHSAVIQRLNGDPPFCSRLRNMGFLEGERVGVVKHAPLADPMEYRIRRIHVSLRREEASRIVVSDIREGIDDLGPVWGRCRRGAAVRCRRGRRRGWSLGFWGGRGRGPGRGPGIWGGRGRLPGKGSVEGPGSGEGGVRETGSSNWPRGIGRGGARRLRRWFRRR
ncbi:MAG: ferrous iron transport protein A [Candidatus Eisenbacteria sp.]|nr:ferrous iron transport protein A [Candidatus Eisenbacteria bacterium]